MGAESGVQKNLNTIRKGITPDQIRKAVREAQDAAEGSLRSSSSASPARPYEEGLETIGVRL